MVLGKGLLTSEGDFWLRQRRLIQPMFLRNRIHRYPRPMVAATERLARRMARGRETATSTKR